MLTNKFKKSSFSPHPYCCVTCKFNNNIIQVAHSNNHEKAISYSIPEWEAFIKGVKSGEFDISENAL